MVYHKRPDRIEFHSRLQSFGLFQRAGDGGHQSVGGPEMVIRFSFCRIGF